MSNRINVTMNGVKYDTLADALYKIGFTLNGSPRPPYNQEIDRVWRKAKSELKKHGVCTVSKNGQNYTITLTQQQLAINPTKELNIDEPVEQKISLERDMEKALRRDITSLEPTLKIIDKGMQRKVDSGFIDITCEDDNGLVVIELKAGKADRSAVGQILGYIGDLQDEESDKTVRGILVANDFDKSAKAAARTVPTLNIKKYFIEFKFMDAV
jgi:RecB family endonuclease NucS